MQGRGGIFLPSPVFYSPGHLCCSCPLALDDEIMNTGSYLMCGLLISQIVLPVGAEQSKTYNTGLVRRRLEGKRGPAELWECHFSDSVKVKRVENPAWYKDFAHEIEKNCSSSLQNGAKYLLTFKDGKVGKPTAEFEREAKPICLNSSGKSSCVA